MEGTRTNIGFVCSSRAWGGLELNTLRLARWLTADGHRITIFATPESPLYKESLSAGLPVEPIQYPRRYFDLPGARKLSRRLKDSGIRIVFGFHNRDLDILAWVKFLFRRDLLLIYQQHMRLGISKRDPVHTLRYSLYDAWIAPLALLQTETIRQTRFPSKKIRLIPLGIEVRHYAEPPMSRAEARDYFGIKSGATVLGIMGRISPGKGQDFLVEAAARLRKGGRNVEVLIVGEPTRDEEQTHHDWPGEVVRATGMERHVYTHPFLKENRIFYRAIDIFVLASGNETYGMVTLEAMASGVPIIATNTGGTPEIVDHGKAGLLFAPGNMEEFLTRVKYILDGGRGVSAMIAYARGRVERFFSHRYECDLIAALLTELGKKSERGGHSTNESAAGQSNP